MVKQTVLAQFDAIAASQPKRVAIFWGKDRITYGQLAARIEVCARELQTQLGVQPGDRVGLLLKNCPEFVVVMYAALKSGATVVPVNSFLKAPEIQYIADDCKIKCLITSSDFDEVTSKLQNVTLVSLETLFRRSDLPAATGRDVDVAPTLPTVVPNELALIVYTSGTTGKPKGAMLSHDNIASNVRSCIHALDGTSADRLTLLLPMFHSFMLTVCIFTPLSMGAAMVLIRSVSPLKAAMKEIIFSRATIFIGIPQIFQALAQAKIPFWMHWVLRLRMAVSGAAPLPHETLRVFEEKMRFPLLEGYGLSEASPVVSFNPLHGVRKGGSVGLPLRDIEVRIVDDHGREVPQGEVGEIVVRGPNVMQGYYNQPEETALSLRDGWLHTGDMGKKDSDGYVFIVDRRKEMLLVRGMNVYPREIEEVLHQFPNVREVAVVAKPDEKRGEVPVAFVSPIEGATLNPTEIQQFLRDRLADYKLPKEIRLVESLPRTATGKIAKLELKKALT